MRLSIDRPCLGPITSGFLLNPVQLDRVDMRPPYTKTKGFPLIIALLKLLSMT